MSTEPATPEATEGKKKGGINLLIILPLVIFLGLATLFLLQMAKGGDPSQIPSVLINKPAPEFDLPALEGFEANGAPMPGFKTSDLMGQVTLVNIWGSWCPACRDEHPMLLEMNKDNRYRLVGIAYKDEPQNAARFLNNHGNAFDAVGLDLSGRTGIDWGVYGAPETFIVDRKGVIRYKHIGPLTPTNLRDSFMPVLEKILAEKS